MSVKGELLLANDRKNRAGRISVIESDGAEHLILVPEGMMADIVCPLWGQIVVVEGTQTREGIRLEDIRKADG